MITSYCVNDLINHMMQIRREQNAHVAYVDGGICTNSDQLIRMISVSLQYPGMPVISWDSFKNYFPNFDILCVKKVVLIIDRWSDCVPSDPEFRQKCIDFFNEQTKVVHLDGMTFEYILNSSPSTFLPRQGITYTDASHDDLDAYTYELRMYHHYFVVALHGEYCRTSSALFSYLATGFQFPSYFGMNWDALDECICDLSWLRFSGIALVIYDSDYLLSNERDDLAIWKDILHNAVSHWKDCGVSFCVLFQKSKNP